MSDEADFGLVMPFVVCQSHPEDWVKVTFEAADEGGPE